MKLDAIPFRKIDTVHFNAICWAMTRDGLEVAFERYPNKNFDVQTLKGKWEGAHLVKFFSECNKLASKEAVSSAFDAAEGWSFSSAQGYISKGNPRRNKEDLKRLFEIISTFRGISLFECFVDYWCC